MSKITPALNDQVIKRAMEIAENEGLDNSPKGFDKAYNKAIKELGYTPAYFKREMSKIGPNPF